MDLLQLSAFLEKLSEAEVCEFVGLVLDEYVGGFEISMDD